MLRHSGGFSFCSGSNPNGRAEPNMTKITKAEFETLPEALKAECIDDGDAYVLQKEDVEGLKKSKAEILAEKKRIQDERDELAKFKADQDAAKAKEAEDLLLKQGEFEKAQAARDGEWQ